MKGLLLALGVVAGADVDALVGGVLGSVAPDHDELGSVGMAVGVS
jgi:hypothetical protein